MTTLNLNLPQYTLDFVDGKTDTVIWSLRISDIELLAGMLAAGVGIMDDVNSEGDGKYYVDSNVDVSSFRLINEVPEQDIAGSSCTKMKCDTTGTKCGRFIKLLPKQYGIWMKSGIRFRYNLFIFKKASFLQGIISMCNAFQVDFRNYIFGLPFDENGNQQAMSNYVLAQYLISIDVPDLNDIEDEEMDDENIIEPLIKDW